MDTVTLRKLAPKSVWDYGKYQGHCVKDIIIINPKYLLWAYYNLERISFIDEILDGFAAQYKKFKRIDKPGVDPDYFEEHLSFQYRKMTKKELYNMITANRLNGIKSSSALIFAYKNAKVKTVHANRNETISKSSLQAMNHGNSNQMIVKTAPKKKK